MGRALRYLPLIAASICALLATISIWVERQVLDNDQWTKTSSEMLEREAIRDAVALFLVDQLYGNVDVAKQLEERLPDDAKPLSAPIAGGLRTLAERQAETALASPVFQGLWKEANRTAHAQLVSFLEGNGDALSATQGEVVLDLRPLVRKIGERVGLSDLDQKLPEQAAEIKVANSDELDSAQDAVVVLKGLALTTGILTLLLYAAHIGLAEGRRRQAIRQVGISLIGVGIAVLALRQLAGRSIVDSLVTTASVEPAGNEAWTVASELLASQGKALIVYGVIAILGAMLAGPSRVATDIRRVIAPWADEPGIAYTLFAVLTLALLLWVPTELTRSLVPALITIGVLALGFEMFRRQVEREWPDAKDPDWGEVVRDIREALAGAFGGARDAIAKVGEDGPEHDEHDRRLGQLERLGKLKQSGVLTQREFTVEKKKLLGVKRSSGRPAAASRK